MKIRRQIYAGSKSDSEPAKKKKDLEESKSELDFLKTEDEANNSLSEKYSAFSENFPEIIKVFRRIDEVSTIPMIYGGIMCVLGEDSKELIEKYLAESGNIEPWQVMYYDDLDFMDLYNSLMKSFINYTNTVTQYCNSFHNSPRYIEYANQLRDEFLKRFPERKDIKQFDEFDEKMLFEFLWDWLDRIQICLGCFNEYDERKIILHCDVDDGIQDYFLLNKFNDFWNPDVLIVITTSAKLTKIDKTNLKSYCIKDGIFYLN